MIETLLINLPLMLSPGPANLVSFGFAARHGFIPVLSFLAGISLVYIIVAIALGAATNHLTEQYSRLADFIKFFGGAFIVYLGIQLLLRKSRNTLIKAPSIWNGITLQLLNPKYPPVVLSVFVASNNQNTLVTAGILSVVGVFGLLIYAATGAIIHHQVNLEKQFSSVNLVFGLLLCLVGLWLMAEPISGYVTEYAT